jgi:hypothetical protein
MFDVVFFPLIECSSFHIFWSIMIFYIVAHFSPHTWYVILVFWFLSQRLCELAQVKQSVALAFSCIFLIVLLVMGLFYHFGLWCVQLFSTWFDLFWYLTWCFNKMVFQVSLYFHKQVKKGVRKRSHTLVVGHRFFCETWGVCM